MNARMMPAIDPSRRSILTLTGALLGVLSLLPTAAAAQQYAPTPAYAPTQENAPPPANPPPPAAVPAPGYAVPSGYAPPATAPGYAPSPGYAPPPAYAAPPTFAAPPSAAPTHSNAGVAPANTDEVSDFVKRITQSTRFDRTLGVARWRAPLCFSVEGLPENESTFVVQRLSQIASRVGAPLKSQGCSKGSYNFHVVFTLNAAQAAKDWFAHHRDMFESNTSTPSEINRFVDPSSPGPVRVWHAATLFGTDGQPLVVVDPGNPVESPPRLDDVWSLLTSRGVIGLNYAVIIIDGTRAKGAGLAPLADYAALAGLAELDLGAALGNDPTILRLFTEPADARPVSLTSWDQSFLSGLYHADQSPRNQRAQIVQTMAHNISP